MSIQKYPVGHQDFEKIVNEGFVYVDKTSFALQLAKRGGYFFLSRPRRFGKSLFVSTLEYLFKGHKNLFKGLYIEDKWAFDAYPVIKISFSNIGYREMDLTAALFGRLDAIAQDNGIELKAPTASLRFKELIEALELKFEQKVVVLIDEYDKPIIDYLAPNEKYKAIENMATLKSFYSILKDADSSLKLVFITGISKFSQVSIFSDLNNLYDISLDLTFNAICGISQAELEAYFEEELQLYNKDEIREWYNGYKWDVLAESVYNPYSLLSFFSMQGKFTNFWYTTGTPAFLIEMCRQQKMYELKEMVISQTAMNSFNIDNLQVLPILFQTGYLTIKHFDPLISSYTLGYPNKEVKSSYIEGLLEM